MAALVAVAGGASVEPVTITMAEVQQQSPRALAATVLGLAGDRVIERQIAEVMPGGDSVDISFASQPTSSGWSGLCQASVIDVTFRTQGGPRPTERRLSFERLSSRMIYRLPAQDVGASSEEMDIVGSFRKRDRACGAMRPVLSTRAAPGFFKLDCDWLRCGTARDALFAARAVALVSGRVDGHGYQQCRTSTEATDYCETAKIRARKAISAGFETLSIKPCRDDRTLACVVGTIFQAGDGFNVSVEIATTVPMRPDQLVPALLNVTGVKLDAYKLPPA